MGGDPKTPPLVRRRHEAEQELGAARITALVPPRPRRTPLPAARSHRATALVRMASAAAYGLVGDRASSIALVESGLAQLLAVTA